MVVGSNPAASHRERFARCRNFEFCAVPDADDVVGGALPDVQVAADLEQRTGVVDVNKVVAGVFIIAISVRADMECACRIDLAPGADIKPCGGAAPFVEVDLVRMNFGVAG